MNLQTSNATFATSNTLLKDYDEHPCPCHNLRENRWDPMHRQGQILGELHRDNNFPCKLLILNIHKCGIRFKQIFFHPSTQGSQQQRSDPEVRSGQFFFMFFTHF